MLIYATIIVLLMFLSYKLDGKPDTGRMRNDAVYMAVYLMLVCVMGFSRELGGDKMAYLDHYEECVSWADGWGLVSDYIFIMIFMGFQPLWSICYITAKTISPDSFALFQFAHALFVNGAVLWFFRKHSHCKYMCVLVYFGFRYFNFNCETMREAVAIAIMLCAMPYFFKKKWKAYYGMAVLAFGFHVSSVMMFALPLIPTFKLNVKRFIMLCGVSVVAYFAANIVLLALLSYLDSTLFAGRYTAYLAAGGNFNGFIGNFITFMLVPGFVVYQMYNSGLSVKPWQDTLIKKYFVIAPALLSFITFNRLFEYFSVFSICLFAEYIWDYSLLRRTFPSAIIVTTLVMAHLVTVYRGTIGGTSHRYDLFYPYTSIFDNTPTYYRKVLHTIATSNEGSVEREE